MNITPLNEADFAIDGYAIIQDVIPPSMLAALDTALAHALALAGQCQRQPGRDQPGIADCFIFEKDLPDAGRDGIPASEVGDAVFIVGDLGRLTPAFLPLLQLPALTRICSACLGTTRPVAQMLNATIKHPRFGRTIAWHRDFPNRYLSSERADFLRVMICLDGMTEDGGATRFVPGSHRLSDEDAIAGHRQGLRHRLAHDAGRAALCERGDVVLIHPKVLHGSPMNRTTVPRRNLVLQVGVEGAALTGEPEAVTGIPLRA